jgi:hypothetical protein
LDGSRKHHFADWYGVATHHISIGHTLTDENPNAAFGRDGDTLNNANPTGCDTNLNPDHLYADSLQNATATHCYLHPHGNTPTGYADLDSLSFDYADCSLSDAAG